MLAPMSMFAQAELTDISTALKTGDVEMLSDYFEDNVEITILEKSDMYAKSKAVQEVKRFFSTSTPVGFKIQHQGNSRSSGSKYAIGILNGKSKEYRVFILTNDMSGKTKIQQLQIEEN